MSGPNSQCSYFIKISRFTIRLAFPSEFGKTHPIKTAMRTLKGEIREKCKGFRWERNKAHVFCDLVPKSDILNIISDCRIRNILCSQNLHFSNIAQLLMMEDLTVNVTHGLCCRGLFAYNLVA